jgi:hypothetical protein
MKNEVLKNDRNYLLSSGQTRSEHDDRLCLTVLMDLFEDLFCDASFMN